ncbi:MAG: DNA repair protein RadC [Deltaproteobacteria bacterium]|nr:DNA repair protein RadC [Deltaproteobacteria bacterium]
MTKYAYHIETKRIRDKDFPYNNEDLSSPERVFQFCRTIQDLDIEKLIILHLNALNRLICIQLFSGTINSAVAFPREIIKHALLSGSCNVIMVHNHPSGGLKFSDADIRLTRLVKEACTLVDIRLLDHVLIGDGQTSMQEQGLI